jgi:hypothetical protein
MASYIERRKFLATLLGGAAAAWPPVAHAQQPAIPVIGFLHGGSAEANQGFTSTFRQGLKQTGFSEGQNLAIEFRWADGHYDRLPGLASDLIGRQPTSSSRQAVTILLVQQSQPPQRYLSSSWLGAIRANPVSCAA